jgi:diguanylate cyclase (GGDEF)-like protein
MLLFGAVTVLTVLPFAIYRVLQAQWLVAAVDAGIMLVIGLGVAHLWRGGRIERVVMVVAAAYNLGCMLIANLIGLTGALWMYPVLLANFMLLGWRPAIAVSSVAVAAMMLSPGVFASGAQLLLFMATALVTGLFAFIFAYRSEQQRQQLEQLAARDPLTGAFNRRALQHELQVAIETAHRQGLAFGLALLDLDHFKRINDNYGHEAGDQVLVEFTRLVQSGTRRLDRFFRYGGEEFVLLLPGADAQALRALCEHVRELVAEESRLADLPITVSIGAAALLPGEDAQGWLARADAAMYEAKRRGRNRVVVAAADEAEAEAPLAASV